MTFRIIRNRPGYHCLKQDTKPTTSIATGAIVYELDTGSHYEFDGTEWVKKRTEAVDSTTNARIGIDYAHHEIHGGSGYTLSYPITVPAANEVEIRIAIPNTTKWPHMVWGFTNDADFSITVFEGTAKTHESGNALIPINRNRNSAKVSGLVCCHTPGAGADGNIIWTFAGGANKTVTTAENRNEFILKQNTPYLVNLAGAQNDVAHLLFDWYEHTNK
jgi:hypothetical protein